MGDFENFIARRPSFLIKSVGRVSEYGTTPLSPPPALAVRTLRGGRFIHEALSRAHAGGLGSPLRKGILVIGVCAECLAEPIRV